MNITKLLTVLKCETVHYKANPGNGGDALIASATFQYFVDNNIQYKIIEPNMNLNDKVIMYSGGGNLIPDYNDCAEFIRETHKIARALIILPHTIAGHEDLLSELGDNVYIYCREMRTYEYVKKATHMAHVFVEHDMALSLDYREMVKKYSTYRPYKIYIKQMLKKAKTPTLLSGYNCLNAFRCDVEKTNIELPEDNIDLSDAINYSSQMNAPDLVNQTTADIFKFISFYKFVNTNRLHIAIAATLLDKKVKFYPNSYYKNYVVYKHSLKERKNIEFIKE